MSDKQILKHLRQHYRYHSRGHLIRLTASRGTFAGREVKGWRSADGYIYFTLKLTPTKRRTFKMARAIFAMKHGWFPEEVDHKNRVREDNRLRNLRAATRQENAQNLGKYKEYRYPRRKAE